MNISATKRQYNRRGASQIPFQVHEELPFAGHLAMHMNILRKRRISKSYVAWVGFFYRSWAE